MAFALFKIEFYGFISVLFLVVNQFLKGFAFFVRKNGFDLTFLVKDIIKKRVSATLAAPCYEDLTPDSEKNKYKDWYIGKASAEMRGKGEGRPTKRERREIDDYKDENYFEFDFDEDEL
mgnify:CR=1 FL=1